jgi:hypothetical protein
VYVAARIISTSDKELISRIVAATNRQNNMTKDAITVLDKIHRDIEAHFEAYPESRRLYYERRPKQFASQKIEKTRILSRQQLTKAYAAMFLEEAHRVSRLSELVASRGEDLFRESHDPLEYYAAASTYYRVEWLFRNQRLASTYGPLRYHLMALVKAYILGPDKLPVGVQKRKAACERILAVVWDAEKATDLVKQLVDPAQAAAKAEGFPDVSLTEVVRKPHFRLSALNAVLQLARAATP